MEMEFHTTIIKPIFNSNKDVGNTCKQLQKTRRKKPQVYLETSNGEN